MEYVTSAARLIGSALRFVFQQINDLIVAQFFRDATYRSGFVWGLITALVVGYVSKTVLYWWNRILQFFKPTKGPADPSKGPSPYAMFRQFLLSLLVVGSAIALLIVMIIIVWWTV
jgi:hypothetical protein